MNQYRQEAIEFYNNGVLSMQRGDWTSAIKNYSQALLREPNFIEAWENRASVRRIKGDLEDALNDISLAIQKFPQRASLYYNRALVQTTREQVNDAIQDYSAAIELEPRYSIAYANRANLYLQQGRVGEAETDLTQALMIDPKDMVALYHRSQIRYQDQNYEGAIADLDQVIVLDSLPERKAFAQFQRASLYAVTGDLASAIVEMQSVIQSGVCPIPTHELHQSLSYFQQLQEQRSGRTIAIPPSGVSFAEAMQGASPDPKSKRKLSASLANDPVDTSRNDPQNVSQYLQRAEIAAESGKLEAAIADLNLAIQLDNRNAAALSQRAGLYAMLHQMDKALLDINRALALEPNNAVTLANLAMIHIQSKELEKALLPAQRAYELNPLLANAHFVLGTCFDIQGKQPHAYAAYSRAIEIDPDAVSAHNNQGKVCLMMGLLDVAMPCFQRTLAIQPNHVRALYNMGAVLMGQERVADALTYFERSAQLGYELAQQTLKDLNQKLKHKAWERPALPSHAERRLMEGALELAKFAYTYCGPDQWAQSVEKKRWFGFGSRQVLEARPHWSLNIEKLVQFSREGYQGKMPVAVLDLLQSPEVIVHVAGADDDHYRLSIAPDVKTLERNPDEIRKMVKNTILVAHNQLQEKLHELVQRNILEVRNHKLCYTGKTIQA